MSKTENERLEEIRNMEAEKFNRIKKKNKNKKIILGIFLVFVLTAIILLIYLYLTKEVRMEKAFNEKINVIYDKVLEENEKKQNDPYYEYYGINAETRKSFYNQSYEQIKLLILDDITEGYYILEENELTMLGIAQIKGPFLVNYEKKLVFSIEPLVLESKILYTATEILNNYQVEKKFDRSGANYPELFDGMIPIIYNKDSGVWEKFDEQDELWYDYSNKKWANIMLSDCGENEINGSMFVWIPRFAYKISDKNYNTNKSGIIDIKFLVDNTNVTIDGIQVNPNNFDCVSDYVIHPAFKFGQDISGIWVSKFEASSLEDGELGEDYGGGNDLTKTYKSMFDRYSWANTTISTAFTVCRNMRYNNIYGLNAERVDTHLMKNTEWGAVAYLSQSKYGRNNNEVWVNNYLENRAQSGNDLTKTGYAGKSSKDVLYGTDPRTSLWNTENGVKASTTGNVYGVYDMSGGCIERTAAYIDNGSKSLKNEGKALYEENDLKYKDVYKSGEVDNELENYKQAKNVVGDAVYETSLSGNANLAWFSEIAKMPCQEYPFFYRGGNAINGKDSGIFAFSKSSGGLYFLAGFRAVITENTD